MCNGGAESPTSPFDGFSNLFYIELQMVCHGIAKFCPAQPCPIKQFIGASRCRLRAALLRERIGSIVGPKRTNNPTHF